MSAKIGLFFSLRRSRHSDRAGVLRAAETPGPFKDGAPRLVRGAPSHHPGTEGPSWACKHSGVPSQPPTDITGGFDKELGLTYLEVGPDGVRAQLEIQKKLLQPWGIVHGGVYCSIIESIASISAHTWLSENGGGTVVGVNNNTDFLRAISSGTVYAVSTPIHRGRRQQLWLTTITDENDRLIARGQVRLQNIADR
jgi:1,4-dihydroxy-2-naphthoyl-CoA hydrolase